MPQCGMTRHAEDVLPDAAIAGNAVLHGAVITGKVSLRLHEQKRVRSVTKAQITHSWHKDLVRLCGRRGLQSVAETHTSIK